MSEPGSADTAERLRAALAARVALLPTLPVPLSPPSGRGPRVRPLGDTDPRRVADYSLVGRLGAGGMGVVYLARSRSGRLVALKVIRSELRDDASFRRRFAREVAAARTVHGAFTAPVLDADVEADPPWLATAYVAGPSLAQWVDEHGPMGTGAGWLLGAGLAEALTAIQSAGLVHRDLKPSNVILAADGPRVIDFGIARALEAATITESGFVVGSPSFIAPEQVRGDAVGPAADVFSLGATVLYAVTGRLPFGEGGVGARLQRILEARPDLAGVDPDLGRVLGTTLALDPAVRPSASQLVAAFGDGGRRAGGGDWPVLDTDAGPFRPAPVVRTLLLPRERRRPLAAALAVMAVVLGALAVAWALRPGAPPTTDAQRSTRSSSSAASPSTAPTASTSTPAVPAGGALAQRLLTRSDLPSGWQLSGGDPTSAAGESACGRLGGPQPREVVAVAFASPDGAESGMESLSRFAGAAEARAALAELRTRIGHCPPARDPASGGTQTAKPNPDIARIGTDSFGATVTLTVAGRTSTGHAVYARVGSIVVRVSLAVSAGSVDDAALTGLARAAAAKL